MLNIVKPCLFRGFTIYARNIKKKKEENRMRSLNNIRSLFLEFFKNRGHEVVTSSPLVPHNDPTLMFTNAGMVQFKHVFTGEDKRSYSRAVSSQKCVRAGGKHNDLDNVGYTARHHTFFEMLGNFSFGDYFKEDAIKYAWDFLTKELGLDKEKLYITVHSTDDEAKQIWKKITEFADEKIITIATDDNFWSMGNTGPCGPCTEIFYDHGEHIEGGLPGTPGGDGDRYIEIWNLVFMQYEQLEGGKRANLPKPCVDTGMGLERIAAVMQGVHDNYDTDLFVNLISFAENIVKVKAEGEARTSYRVIADHLRSTAFLVAEGVMPSNEGRGYVLRRIMRRAMRHAHQLWMKKPLMHQLVPSLVKEMGQAFPELKRAEKLVTEIFYQEELRFKATLDKGLKLLEEKVRALRGGKEFKGDDAFKLYDTYGFPLDLTMDILRGNGISVDIDRFNECMKEQKERARAAWSGSGETTLEEVWFDIADKHGATEFLGYELDEAQGVILEIVDAPNGKKHIITNQTTFYGESGGQMGDRGLIIADGEEIAVENTKKFLGKLITHIVDSKDCGNLKVGGAITLKIDVEYRASLRANHSATHILHDVLRKTLGEHVTQKGSLVAEDKLRFDISHPKALTREEILLVETEVNARIRENATVNTKIMGVEEAMENGAMALFGEKYDEEVRVVSMGESTELCGGTHVKRTGDIGFFKITNEAAIAAGIRRIEAITGKAALDYVQKIESDIYKYADILKTSPAEIENRVAGLLEERKKLEKQLLELKKKALLSDNSDADDSKQIGDIAFFGKILDDVSPKDLRAMVDSIRQSSKMSAIVCISRFEGKASIVTGVTKDATDKCDAAAFVKIAVASAGGQGGGGRKDIAQAGGFDYNRSKEAILSIQKELEKI
jgi:alanyl-tRNA synthetase